MDEHEVIINNIRDLFIDMNKGTITEDNIIILCNKHKQGWKKMDHAYRCMRSIHITNNRMSKTNDHIKNIVLLWRELNFLVTSSARSFEDQIIHQINLWWWFIMSLTSRLWMYDLILLLTSFEIETEI